MSSASEATEPVTVEAAFRRIPRPVMVFRALRDEHGTIRDLEWVASNDMAAALVGRSPDVLVGRRLLEELPGNEDAGLFDAYCGVIESGAPHVQTLRYSHDGFDHWFEIHANRTGDGVVVSFDDVTSRRSLEADRDEARRQMRAVFLSAPFPVIVVDASTMTIVSANRSASEVFAARFENGASFVDGFAGSQCAPALVQAIKRVGRGEDVQHLSEQFFAATGRFVNIAVARVLTTELVELVAMDVTSLVDARKQAQRSNRRKGKVLAVLGHELRNPLHTMSTAVEALSLANPRTTVTEQVTETMRRQIELSNQLLENILDATRIEHDKMALNLERCDLVELAKRTTQDLALSQPNDRVCVIEDWPVGPLMAVCDPVRFKQIVANLVSNAIKFTPEGSVTVSLRGDGRHAVLRVEDTGLGIPHDELDDIFDAFEQVEQHYEHKRGGLGLGLSLVSRLLALHGGTIRASSEGEGKGSCFTARLPLEHAP